MNYNVSSSRRVLIGALVGWSGATVAQTAADGPVSRGVTDSSSLELSEIVVSGSRIARSGFQQPTPTVTVGQDFLAESAAANLSDALNELPQLRASLTPSANTATVADAGKNIVDLRGLGAQRTLVLVNGQRFVSGILEGPIDLNAIPQALISSVDIVTGGASAAYGSDAVAGVVNIRLQNNLNGFKGTVQGGASTYGDDRDQMVSLAYGTPLFDAKAQLTLSAEWNNNTGVTNIQARPWAAAQPGQIVNPAYSSTNGQPANLLLSSGAVYSNSSYGGVISSGPLKGTQFGPGGTPLPFNYGSLTTSTTQRGGDGAYLDNNLYLSVPTERKVVYGHFGGEISAAFKPYVEASYADTTATAVSNTRNDQVTIQADNAFLPASIGAAMAANSLTSFTMGRFSNDYGNVHVPSVTKTWRSVLGATGDLGGSWSYDAYYTHGNTDSGQYPQGVRITSNYNNAVNAVINPATGSAVCRSVAAQAAGCVPIDLFGSGSPSSEAVAYITTNTFRNANLTQDAGGVTVRGTPLSTWAGPVSVAGGGEARRDAVDFEISSLAQQFALATGNGLPWHGSVAVAEGFAESVVPLLSNATLVRALELDLAGRVTHYTTSGTVETWKTGLNWNLDDRIRLRGTVSRDIKAPSLNDLYAAGLTNIVNVTDTKLNQTYNTVTLTGGTRSLEPERSTTKTLGVVFTEIAPGFNASVDYYDIAIHDALATLAAQNIINGCYSNAPGLCSLIQRNSAGQIANISIVPQNLQTIVEKGVDIESQYKLPLLGGTLTLHPTVSYVDTLSYSNGGGSTQLAGSIYTAFTVGTNGVPHWRGLFDVGYALGAVDVSADARFIGAANINNSYTPENLNVLRVPGITYFDASAAYSLIDSSRQTLKVYFRVANLANKYPPLVNDLFGTEPTLYDVIGRTFTLGLKYGL